MPRFLTQRPRASLAALIAAGSAALVIAAAPSAANVDPRAAFDTIDADRSGSVVFDEFAAYLEREGLFLTRDAPVDAPERVASESEVLSSMHSEFARYDRNRDGVVSYREFSSRYIWQMETSFNAIDRNRDGFIESRELARVMGSIGLDPANIDRTRLQRAIDAIATVDANGDGQLDFAEYTAVD